MNYFYGCNFIKVLCCRTTSRIYSHLPCQCQMPETLLTPLGKRLRMLKPERLHTRYTMTAWGDSVSSSF
ncbi:hypothetical protein PSPTOT1_5391 [Pseudomonas syringae pv. tomato T1]|nr:hypothetical protein PSPTOT1_5391 [Pseudomonas syringae pv. tomato T1]